jgi:hypothetical protein
MSGPAAPPAGIDAAMLAEALAIADRAATLSEAAAALRARFAGLRIVGVDAFDMRDETPAARGATRQLYFGSHDGHCWAVTADAARAAGLFIADRG